MKFSFIIQLHSLFQLNKLLAKMQKIKEPSGNCHSCRDKAFLKYQIENFKLKIHRKNWKTVAEFIEELLVKVGSQSFSTSFVLIKRHKIWYLTKA